MVQVRRKASAKLPPRTLHDEIRIAKRNIILERAAALFAEKGYHGASMDAIAESAGISKPLIYSQFSNKIELLTEIYKRVVARSFDCLTRADRPDKTPTEILSDFARYAA